MSPRVALIACCVATALMGSVHAWSIVVSDIEATLGISRTLVSSIYSVALVTLTLSVLAAVPLYTRVSAPVLVGLSMLAAAGGLVLSSLGNVYALFVGYGFIFGAANGIVYGYCLQLSARIRPKSPAFAMALVTASYGFGAVVSAAFLGLGVEHFGGLLSLMMLALVFVVVTPFIVFVLWRTRVSFDDQASNETEENRETEFTQTIDGALIWKFRAAYGFAVASGLMAIAHAGPFFLGLSNSSTRLAAIGVALLGVGNVLGGVAVAIVSERMSVWRLLMALPVISAVALAVAAATGHVLPGIAALIVVGFCYGALIAIYPGAIAKRFGPERSPVAYGRIFLAWGAAGLIAPVAAGTLFDQTASYTVALVIAAILSVLSTIFVLKVRPAADS